MGSDDSEVFISSLDSDNEREEDFPCWRGVPAIIVLINAMERDTASVAQAATCRIVRQSLRSSLVSSQLIGVCLYGVEEQNAPVLGTESFVDVIPLAAPSLDNYTKLQRTDITKFQAAKKFKLSDVLWHCNKIFTNCKKQISSKSILMLTRLDIPPIQSDHKPTLMRVRDLVDANINVKIINIVENNFHSILFFNQIEPFYESFLNEANKGRGFVLPKQMWNEKEIENAIQQETHRHVAVAHLKFEIGEGVSMGVGVYNLIIKNPSMKKVDIDRKTKAVLKSVTNNIKLPTKTTPMDVDESTEPKLVPLQKSEVIYYQTFGRKRVKFTDDEMKKMKNPFGPPLLRLLGFKPTTVICKEKCFFKPSYFLFPNEEIVEGSTVAFKALHQACVETGKVAVCVLCTRVNAKPQLVALSPCKHPLGLDIEIGFDIVHIPFMENIKDLSGKKYQGEISITEEQKIMMSDMIKTLEFDYRPSMFENPKLQSEYRSVEAIALNEDDVDPFVDTTKPAPEKLEGLQEDLFEELFGPFDLTTTKRPANSGDEVGGKKIREEEVDDNTLRLVQPKIWTRTVHELTVPQLRNILNLKNKEDPKDKKKKNELVALVYKYFKQ